jgi:hypothetical protein
MRKVKIFLTMLAIAGVLFATSSCVDNTESESVSKLRDAKAQELIAQGKAAEALAAAQQTLANAQVALAAAQQTLANAQEDYLAALGRADEDRAKADLLLAEADKIRAQGDSISAAAQAAKLIAEADQITSAAESAKAAAAEALRKVIADNNLALAGQADKIAAAEYTAKQQIITAQRSYIQALAALDAAAATAYASYYTNWKNTVDAIAEQRSNINSYTLSINNAKLQLATLAIDSARVVATYKATLDYNIAIDKVNLKFAQRELAIAESLDTGLDGLVELKNATIQDTVDSYNALQAAYATADELAAAVEDATDALVAVTPAYDAVVEKYNEKRQKVTDARANLNAYLNITSVNEIYDVTGIPLNSTGYGFPWVNDGGSGGQVSYTWNGMTFYSPLNPRSYDDYSIVEIYRDDDIVVFCIIDLEYYPTYYGTTWIDYMFAIFSVEGIEIDLQSEYEAYFTSAAHYEYQIEIWKRDSIAKAQILKDTEKELIDSLGSLKTLVANERQYYADSIAAKTALEAAIKAEEAAQKAYDELVADPDADPDDVDDALEDLEDATEAREDAEDDYAEIVQKLRATRIAFAKTNGTIHNLIEAVIAARNEVAKINAILAPVYANLEILKQGNRLELQDAVAAAEQELANFVASAEYTNAVSAYTAATNALYNADDEYWNYAEYIDGDLAAVKGAHVLSVQFYEENIEEIEFLISLGFNPVDFIAKEQAIIDAKTKVATYEDNLARYQIYRDNVTETGYYSTVGSAIQYWKNQIADNEKLIKTAEAKIAELQTLETLYKSALDTLLSSYSE